MLPHRCAPSSTAHLVSLTFRDYDWGREHRGIPDNALAARLQRGPSHDLAPPAPRPKRRRKTKAAPVEPVLSEYELGRRAKIKRNNKFLVSVGLLFPPKEALEDDEHPWWYMTAR